MTPLATLENYAIIERLEFKWGYLVLLTRDPV